MRVTAVWWCHLLLLLPVLGVAFFVALPWPVAVGANALLALLAVGVAVPAAVALRRPVLTGREALPGGVGEAVSDIDEEGLVRYAGELWTAVGAGRRVSDGERVAIVDVRGLTLVVEPLRREPVTRGAQEGS